MADVTIQNVCVNLQPGGRCCLKESPCPFGAGMGEAIEGCGEARLAARVQVIPDEFVVLVTPGDRKPKAGRFPVKRCRVTNVEEAAGVHTTSLLCSLGDAALLDATEVGNRVILTTRDGGASVVWSGGAWLPG